jgi:hypothetical protein
MYGPQSQACARQVEWTSVRLGASLSGAASPLAGCPISGPWGRRERKDGDEAFNHTTNSIWPGVDGIEGRESARELRSCGVTGGERGLQELQEVLRPLSPTPAPQYGQTTTYARRSSASAVGGLEKTPAVEMNVVRPSSHSPNPVGGGSTRHLLPRGPLATPRPRSSNLLLTSQFVCLGLACLVCPTETRLGPVDSRQVHEETPTI